MTRRHTPGCVLSIVLLLLIIPSAAQASPTNACLANSVDAGGPENEKADDAGAGQTPPKKEKPSYQAEDWTVAFYPILAWAPVMGGSISLPDLPPLPSHPIVTQSDVDGGLNGAALFGLSVQKKRFVADFSVLSASIGATQTVPNKASLDTSFLFYDAMAGFKVAKDLSINAGVRHMGLTLDATLGDHPTLNWDAGVTDPMIGMDYRHSLGKHWGIDLNLKGGGFGVGSDVDLSATGRLDWRFARHFGMTMGYGALHFKITSEVTNSLGTFNRETNQTLHGPIIGFGIYF